MKLLNPIILFAFLSLFSCQQKKPQILLSESDLAGKSKEELRIIRNEIFARHGYVFKSQDLKEYFLAKKWYKPEHQDVNHLLTEEEKKNIALIQKFEAVKELNREEKRKPKQELQVMINFKGSKELDGFQLTILSIYEIPKNDSLKYDSSYYLEGHYLTSSNVDLTEIAGQSINLEEFKNTWISHIELVNPCSGISSRQLQILRQRLFSEGEKTVRFLLPECSDYTNNIFISFKDGILTEKFTADTWGTGNEVNFKKRNDSIFYTLTNGRDEIVSQFQSDYRYEYNNRTNKLRFVKPGKQRINWRSEALIELIAYNSIGGAKTQDKSKAKFKIQVGELFRLDTLYRDPGVLLIWKEDGSSGYLNIKNLNYTTITTNTAG